MVKEENGINWLFFCSDNEQELIGHYIEKFGVYPPYNTIWKNNKGIWSYRVHK